VVLASPRIGAPTKGKPMKLTHILIAVLAVVACGGKSSEPAQPKPEPEPPPAPEPKPEPEPEPPPPPPAAKQWHAQAELTPVKGAKFKGATITFVQTEGKPAVKLGSTGWFEGIRSAPYHLVVHDGAACGPNATKAGKPGATIEFVATAGMDALDVEDSAAVQVDGDATIVGRTLVLHEDKQGKPGKALACGPIAASNP
jgi:hypothetical protein